MSGKRVIKRPKKIEESTDPDLILINRQAPYVKVQFLDDGKTETYDSAFLNDEILNAETDEKVHFDELEVGQTVAALWKNSHHYLAEVLEINRLGKDEKHKSKKKGNRILQAAHITFSSSESEEEEENKQKKIQAEKKKQKEAITSAAQMAAASLFQRKTVACNPACLQVPELNTVSSKSMRSCTSQSSSTHVTSSAPSLSSSSSTHVTSSAPSLGSSSITHVTSSAPSLSSSSSTHVTSSAPSLGSSSSTHVTSSAPSLGSSSSTHVTSSAPSLGSSSITHVTSSAPSLSSSSSTHVTSSAPSLGSSSSTHVTSSAPSLGSSSSTHVTSNAPSLSSSSSTHVTSSAPSLGSSSSTHVTISAPSLSSSSSTHVTSSAPSLGSSSSTHVTSSAPSLSSSSSMHDTSSYPSPCMMPSMHVTNAYTALNFNSTLTHPNHHVSQPLNLVSLNVCSPSHDASTSLNPINSTSSFYQPFASVSTHRPGMDLADFSIQPLPPLTSSNSSPIACQAQSFTPLVNPHRPKPCYPSIWSPVSYLPADNTSASCSSHSTTNTNFMTSSFMAIEGGEVDDFDPSEISTSTPLSASSDCLDCVIKDKKIKDLQALIEELKESATSPSCVENASTKKRRYQPKTRPQIDMADFIEVKKDGKIPDGYSMFAPGCLVAVRSLWLHDLLSTIGKARAKKEKKAQRRGSLIRENREFEIIKRLIDGFFDPWELAVEGGTQSFKDNQLYAALMSYSTHVLKMSIPDFKRCWNSKMATARQTIKRVKTPSAKPSTQ